MAADEDGLNALGRWFRLVHSCDCGSSKPYRWFCDEQGNKLFKVCDDCEAARSRSWRDSDRDGSAHS